MARAVINFQFDISSVLPALSQTIPGCAYDLESHQAVFNLRDLIITIGPREILIYNTDQESLVQEILEWLKSIVSQSAK